MSKPTRPPVGADVNRRNFLTRGAAAGVGAVGDRRRRGGGHSGRTATPGIKWDYTADVVVIGAGVAGLPAAIAARDNGASVIVVDENYDIGGRGMLSGGRVQVGGGHALQQKLGINDTPDMIYDDWVRFDHSESRYSDRDLIRVFADENVSDLRLPDRERRRIHREADPVAGCIADRPHLRHQGMAHSEPGHRATSESQRLGPGAAARGKRPQERRADLSQAQDDLGRAREAQCRPRPRHHDRRRQQPGQHPGAQGRHHRDRRPHRQRQLPPHLRSAADRGVPAGLRTLRPPGRGRRTRRHGYRRVAVVAPPTRPPTARRRSPRRATSAAAGATRRWSTSRTARCSRWRAPPDSRSATGRT